MAAWIAATGAALAADPPPRTQADVVVVDGVDVEQVAELRAGVPLNFSIYGTPRALAAVRIEGARRVLALRESEPGLYEGSYVIDAHDAIRADSRVTATLERGGVAVHAPLDEPLLLARAEVPWDDAARAEAAAARPPSSAVTVPSGRTNTRPEAPVDPPPRAPTALARAGERPCTDCALVESVRAIEAPPSRGIAGAIGGAIAGAALGHQLGEGPGRRLLRVLGAIGGGFAGREIERQATRRIDYEVVLRLADGSTVTRRYERAPPFAAGERIRLGAGDAHGRPMAATL